MGKFVDVYLDRIDEYSTSKGYSVKLTLVKKIDSHVLYKVRMSPHAEKNVMVRSNMELLLSKKISKITLEVHDNKAAFTIFIVTKPFHEENLQLQGISFTNFNDMWAFVPENKLDKTILRFDRDASGKPSASFYAPAFENQQEQEVMTVANNKSAPSTDANPLTAQNLAEALSLVQQQNFDQEDEINQLKLKVRICTTFWKNTIFSTGYRSGIFKIGFIFLQLEQAESQLEDANTKANYSRSISYTELMIFACGFFILMNLFYSAFQI